MKRLWRQDCGSANIAFRLATNETGDHPDGGHFDSPDAYLNIR